MWIFNPPGAPGGYMALVLAVGTIIYLFYAFYRYR